MIKNTTTGALTDLDGNYEIMASPGDTLSFSYLGFTSMDLVLTTQRTNDIVMVTDAKTLDEIVVIGYGTIKKSDLTGSIAKIKSEEIIKVPRQSTPCKHYREK